MKEVLTMPGFDEPPEHRASLQTTLEQRSESAKREFAAVKSAATEVLRALE